MKKRTAVRASKPSTPPARRKRAPTEPDAAKLLRYADELVADFTEANAERLLDQTLKCQNRETCDSRPRPPVWAKCYELAQTALEYFTAKKCWEVTYGKVPF